MPGGRGRPSDHATGTHQFIYLAEHPSFGPNATFAPVASLVQEEHFIPLVEFDGVARQRTNFVTYHTPKKRIDQGMSEIEAALPDELLAPTRQAPAQTSKA